MNSTRQYEFISLDYIGFMNSTRHYEFISLHYIGFTNSTRHYELISLDCYWIYEFNTSLRVYQSRLYWIYQFNTSLSVYHSRLLLDLRFQHISMSLSVSIIGFTNSTRHYEFISQHFSLCLFTAMLILGGKKIECIGKLYWLYRQDYEQPTIEVHCVFLHNDADGDVGDDR